jgi:hypothetical protein
LLIKFVRFKEKEMKKLLFALLALNVGFLKAQYKSMNTTGVIVPQYMASGTSTRMPVFARLRLDGLTPNSSYKYIVRAIRYTDFANTGLTTAGAGNDIFIDSQGNYRYSTTTDFTTSGGCDTLSSGMMGSYEGWFGLVNTGNARFTAGNNIYFAVTMLGINNTDTFRYYCEDSIKVLAWNGAAGSNNGTGIWGKSYANAKSMVALYDNLNGFGRPLSLTNVESGSYSGAAFASLVGFYNTNVYKQSNAWGTIVPNTLSSGVLRIDNLSFKTGFSIYANIDSNGVWGPSSKNTVNPTGGSTTPIALDQDDAPLIAPKVEFWTRSSSVAEGAGKVKVFVSRKYSNSAAQSVRLYLVGGTATKGASADFTLTEPKTIIFKPGVAIFDSTEITLNDDVISEGTETVVLRLDNPNNCLIGTEVAHTLSIIDNDVANVSVKNPKIRVNEANANVGITFKLDKAVTTPVKLKMFVKFKSDSTYMPSEFFISSNNNDTTFSLGNANGPDSITINTKTFDDIAIDKSDSIVLVIRQVSGGAFLKDSVATVIIMDNDGPTNVEFVGSNFSITESVSSFNVKLRLFNRKSAGGDFTLRLYSNESTAENPTDYKFSPSSKIINVTSSTPDTIIVNIPIVNDDIYEKTEYIKFGLANLNNIIVKTDTLKITLLDDDFPIYKIGKISKQTSAAKTADSLNVKCRVFGIVYGVNTRSGGLGFTIRDNTGGIGVFSASKTYAYAVKEGDSVMIQGSIGQFQGTVQIDRIDTMIKLAGNRPLVNATVVTTIGETAESNLVRLERVKLMDVAEWPSTTLAANKFAYVRVISTSGTVDTLNIDSETDIDGTSAPTGYFNVTGLGVQFDNSSPYTSKYYLAPRYTGDIVAASLPTVNFMKKTDFVFELADSFKMDISVFPSDENFKFDVVCLGGTAITPTDYDYATKSIQVTKNNNYFFIKSNITDDLVSDGDKIVSFAIRNIDGPGSIGKDSIMILTIKDNEASLAKTFAQGNFKVYPNPANEFVAFSNAKNISKIEVLDMAGRLLANHSMNQTEDIYTMNVTGFSGFVFVRITDLNGQTFVERLVVK